MQNYVCVQKTRDNSVYTEVNSILDINQTALNGVVGYFYPLTCQKNQTHCFCARPVLATRLIADSKTDCKVCHPVSLSRRIRAIRMQKLPREERFGISISTLIITHGMAAIVEYCRLQRSGRVRRNAMSAGTYVKNFCKYSVQCCEALEHNARTHHWEIVGVMSFDECVKECLAAPGCRSIFLSMTRACVICTQEPDDSWDGSMSCKIAGTPMVNHIKVFSDDQCDESTEIDIDNTMIENAQSTKSGTTSCNTALISSTEEAWQPSCDPCLKREAWFTITFPRSIAVRCIRVGGAYPLGKSEGNTSDLIWSGGLQISNSAGLNVTVLNTNEWKGFGIGNRDVADVYRLHSLFKRDLSGSSWQISVQKLSGWNISLYTSLSNDGKGWDGDDGASGGGGIATLVIAL